MLLPSWEGNWTASDAPLLGGAGGGFRSALRAKSSEWSLPATKNVFSVAQIVNLLCRRLPIGRALAESRRSGQGAVLQDDILRYSRLAVCATNTTKELNTYPAVRALGGLGTPIG